MPQHPPVWGIGMGMGMGTDIGMDMGMGYELPSYQHHQQGHNASSGGEVAHECAVGIGVGEGGLQFRLPGHLHYVDGHTVGQHQDAQVSVEWCVWKRNLGGGVHGVWYMVYDIPDV